jgi:hypothetical protein
MDHQIGSTAIEAVDPLRKVERFLHSPNLVMLVRWQDEGGIAYGYPANWHGGARF